MARVAVEFSGVSTGAKKAAAETRTAIKSVRDEATLTDKVAGKLGSTIKSALTVGAKVAGAGVLGLATAVGVAGVKFDDLRQKSQIAFTTMLGSGQKARAFLNDLQSFANKTPFEFPDLIRASQRMLAMGFAAKQVVPSLTAIGDASAALGGTPDTINAITFALGQMQNAGRVNAQDMNQLTQAGINGWGYLAAAAHKSVAQIRKDSENGLLDSRKAVQVILAGMERDYAGMMDKQSHTFSGLLSTLRDTFTQVSGKVMRPFFDMATRGMQSLVDMTSKPEFTAGVNRFADALSTKVGGAARDVVGFFREHWGEIKDDLYSLGQTARTTAADVKAIAVQANKVADALGGWDDVIKVALAAAVVAKFSTIAGSLTTAAKGATTLEGVLGGLAKLRTIGIAVALTKAGDSDAWDIALAAMIGSRVGGPVGAAVAAAGASAVVAGKAARGKGVDTMLGGVRQAGTLPDGRPYYIDGGIMYAEDPKNPNVVIPIGPAPKQRGGVFGGVAQIVGPSAAKAVGTSPFMVAGHTGKITSGLASLERASGGAVIDDFATGGHAKNSYHYKGEAVDLAPDYSVWLRLLARKEMFAELLSPWGLYNWGVEFYDAELLAQHSGSNAHIHVAYTGGSPAIVRAFGSGGMTNTRKDAATTFSPDDGSNVDLYGGGDAGKTKKPKITRGISLLSNAVRTQIAHAGRTTSTADDLKAYGAALAELRGRLKTATGGQRTAIEEEITGIQKRINAINTKAYEDRLKKMAAETKKRLTEAKEAVQKAEGDFKTAYGRLAERAMDAFERETQKRLDKIDSDLKERLAAIDKSRDDLTPEEQAYKAFQDARQAAEDERKRKELASAVEAARKSLGALDATATADERAKLQADVENALQDQADFELDLRERTLQAQADASRKARNDELDAQEQAARDSADQLKQQVQDERDIERQNFQDRIDDLEKFLLGRHLGVAAANDEMLKMMQEFGLDPTWFTSGQNAADSWIQGLAQAFTDAGISLDALGARQDAVAAISRASSSSAGPSPARSPRLPRPGSGSRTRCRSSPGAGSCRASTSGSKTRWSTPAPRAST